MDPAGSMSPFTGTSLPPTPFCWGSVSLLTLSLISESHDLPFGHTSSVPGLSVHIISTPAGFICLLFLLFPRIWPFLARFSLSSHHTLFLCLVFFFSCCFPMLCCPSHPLLFVQKISHAECQHLGIERGPPVPHSFFHSIFLISFQNYWPLMLEYSLIF